MSSTAIKRSISDPSVAIVRIQRRRRRRRHLHTVHKHAFITPPNEEIRDGLLAGDQVSRDLLRHSMSIGSLDPPQRTVSVPPEHFNPAVKHRRRPFWRRKSFSNRHYIELLGLAQEVAESRLELTPGDGIDDNVRFDHHKPHWHWGRFFMTSSILVLPTILFVLGAVGIGVLVTQFDWVGNMSDMVVVEPLVVRRFDVEGEATFEVSVKFNVSFLMYNPSHILTTFNSFSVGLVWLESHHHSILNGKTDPLCIQNRKLYLSNCSPLPDDVFIVHRYDVSVSPMLIAAAERTQSFLLHEQVFRGNDFMFVIDQAYTQIAVSNYGVSTLLSKNSFAKALYQQCKDAHRVTLLLFCREIVTTTWIYHLQHSPVVSEPLVLPCTVMT